MKTRPTVTIYPEDVLAHSELVTFERAQAFLIKYQEAIGLIPGEVRAFEGLRLAIKQAEGGI